MKKIIHVTMVASLIASLQSSVLIGGKDKNLSDYYTTIDVDENSNLTNEDLNNYENLDASVEVVESNESYRKIRMKNTISSDQFTEISEVSTLSEDIEVVAETEYFIEDEMMEITLDFIDEEEVVESISIEANVYYDDEGDINGSFIYEGVEYDIAEALSLYYDNGIIIETFAISTAVIVGLVAGAIVGGVTGAIISYNKYNTIKWRYVVGGTIIGGAFGAAAGYGIGLMYGGTVSMSSAVSNIAKNPGQLKITKTVANHIPKRKYINSSKVVSEIIKSAKPTKDKYLRNGLRWIAPGANNGTKGVWELVIDMDSKTIVHFLFRK